VAFWDSGANPIIDYADASIMPDPIRCDELESGPAQVWLHNNLNTNHVATGLAEGFHILRARPSCRAPASPSVYNTFLQTFYYDTRPPDGAIAFPPPMGRPGQPRLRLRRPGRRVRGRNRVQRHRRGSQQRRRSHGFANGNGFDQWRARVRPRQQRHPVRVAQRHLSGFSRRNSRFTYFAVPPSGAATVTVRIKEFTTATFPDDFARSSAR
jgi:hypothetical protein